MAGVVVSWRSRLMVGLLHAVVFTPVAYRAVYRTDDWQGPNLFPFHTGGIPLAFTAPWEPGHVQFLWHSTGRAAIVLAGTSDLRFGAVVATGIAYAVFGVCIFEVLRRADGGGALLITPVAAAASLAVALLETPAALLGWERLERPDGVFIPLFMPFVPTTMASLGLDVLLVWFASRLLRGELGRGGRIGLPVVVVLAAAAKPNLAAPLLPALLILAWWSAGRPTSPRRWWSDRTCQDVVVLAVLPGAVITVVQLLIAVYQIDPEYSGGWRFAPLAELSLLQAWSAEFWLVLVFPVVALAVLGPRLWDDLAVRLIYAALVVGLVASLLLERTGTDYRGDLLQFVQTACAMLVVFVPRRLVDLRRNDRVSGAEVAVLGAVLAVYLVAGLMSWSCNIGAGCLVA